MPSYKYRAKKGSEGVIENIIEAHSEKEAVEKIIQLGFTPVRIEIVEKKPAAESKTGLPARQLGKIRFRQITIFTRQLAGLLKSGVPILTSLNIISDQSENVHLKEVLRGIHNGIKDGETFSSGLSGFPKIFPPLYIALVRTGEDSGALPGALLRIVDYREKQEEMLSRFRMALAYPVLMAVVGLGTIIFMLTFVMPRIMQIFVNMGQRLPLPTRILISLSEFLRNWWFWVILFLIILFARRRLRAKSAKLPLSLFKLHLPIFGKFILKAELSRFCRTLELLIKSGIPILNGIEIAVPVLNNEVLVNQLKLSYKDLEQGGSFGRSLKNSKLFPPFMSNLIIVGEESGRLDEALGEVAAFYERDTDELIRIMSSLLEPLMILVMGLIVGFIVVSMLLPIFDINIMAE
jgi:type II secretory pathway component PulF